jgi:hypothetical protein
MPITLKHLVLAQSMPLLQVSPSFSLHAPAPLQTFVVSQTGASSVLLSGTFVQVPTVPARLHDLQVVSHALLQQTVSAQNPLLQSIAAAHVAPSHFFMHEPPQSMPVSSPFIMPSLHEMHAPITHVGCVPTVQSASAKHETQLPIASHFLPPPHPAPTLANFVSGTPLLQPSIVHMFPSNGGISLLSMTEMMLPAPSQASVMQSPFVGSLMVVPFGANVEPHMPIMHDQFSQAVSGGQSPELLHGVPPLELLELLELLDEDDDEDADDDDDDDEVPPPAPAEPLEELELTSAPALPPLAVEGSN